MSGLIGKKIGMTSIFDETGQVIPCTVIEAGPCFVTQVKASDRDGYSAIQLGFNEQKERLVTKPLRGHFAKSGCKPQRFVREFKADGGTELQPGQEIRVDTVFAKGDVVSIIGTSSAVGIL